MPPMVPRTLKERRYSQQEESNWHQHMAATLQIMEIQGRAMNTFNAMLQRSLELGRSREMDDEQRRLNPIPKRRREEVQGESGMDAPAGGAPPRPPGAGGKRSRAKTHGNKDGNGNHGTDNDKSDGDQRLFIYSHA